jgi:hypothetical protein
MKGAEFYARIAQIKMERGCIDCGFNKWPEALEFDHLPGSVKEFALSRTNTRRWEAVEAELLKCEVVCSNCHHHRTVVRRGE